MIHAEMTDPQRDSMNTTIPPYEIIATLLREPGAFGSLVNIGIQRGE